MAPTPIIFVRAHNGTGRSRIHVQGCSHLRRLWEQGGGVVDSSTSLDVLRRDCKGEEGYMPALASCARQRLP